ncbi:GDSL esterase/lipase At5g45950 [Prosopis cineraria]|uniref:GDSL esterase/lipase At5g45950 n=1 Tax=Prosopis cineraria TaxID=364024 RepID=UPI002410A7BD|nr:GDSL esterase/lipase At5g45950 [Prosopis cineraria]
MPWLSLSVGVPNIRQLAIQYNVSCILVFGDSSVDPGNNNVLPTLMKSNFAPYGKDFFNGRPTGRFSDGRLASDFLAEAVGYRKTVPAFLDPNLKLSDLPHGVSFASAATGYDDFTANISNVLPVSKQLEYFEHYKIHLRKLVGVERSEFIVRNALYIISMGTNDFLQNYFLDPTRPNQFSILQFQNFLLSRFSHTIEGMHRLGAKRIIVVGVPPMGCLPLMKALQNKRDCVASLNRISYSFNSKILHQMATLRAKLGVKMAYVDVYNSILNAVLDPIKHGFEEGSKGCCGTGTVEYGESCRGLETCSDPSKYIFWDAVHPTEMMYKIVGEAAIRSVARELTS